MSGIDEIKKKAKLSIDEMYENQSVGLLETQNNGKAKKKQTTYPESHAVNKSNTTTSQQLQTPIPAPYLTTNPSQENHSKLDSHATSLGSHFAYPNPKPQTYKMTFNLTEEMYKAFNDLYANRMLQGRKTEKSDLICEAIQWLIKMEDNLT